LGIEAYPSDVKKTDANSRPAVPQEVNESCWFKSLASATANPECVNNSDIHRRVYSPPPARAAQPHAEGKILPFNGLTSAGIAIPVCRLGGLDGATRRGTTARLRSRSEASAVPANMRRVLGIGNGAQRAPLPRGKETDVRPSDGTSAGAALQTRTGPSRAVSAFPARVQRRKLLGANRSTDVFL
jgi:hypothetical protein